jgi:hypothetical protein
MYRSAPRAAESLVISVVEIGYVRRSEFNAAIKSGAVHPAVTRSEILELAAEASSDESTKTTQQTKSSLSALKLLWAMATDADRKQFIEWCMNNA